MSIDKERQLTNQPKNVGLLTEKEIQEMLDKETDEMNSYLDRYDIRTLTRAFNEIAQTDNKGILYQTKNHFT